jgi:hypothetical protein
LAGPIDTVHGKGVCDANEPGFYESGASHDRRHEMAMLLLLLVLLLLLGT